MKSVQMEIKEPLKKVLKNFLMMIIGCAIYALGISLFLSPINIAPGGISGLAIIICYLIEFPTGTMYFILNVPILIYGLVVFGKSFLATTVFATFLCSALIDIFDKVFAPFLPFSDDLLLGGIFGGVLTAIGMGLVFRTGSTTGGTDIIAKALRVKNKGLKMGGIYCTIDAFVVALSALAFKDIEIALYATVSIFIASYVLDIVLYGSDSAEMFFIISDKSEQIASRLMTELEIGTTYLEGTGAYTGKKKKVLFCCSKKQRYPKIREIVTEIDDKSFLIVSGAKEIFGEGFKRHGNDSF